MTSLDRRRHRGFTGVNTFKWIQAYTWIDVWLATCLSVFLLFLSFALSSRSVEPWVSVDSDAPLLDVYVFFFHSWELILSV